MSLEDIATYSVMGVMKFDAHAVAECLRKGTMGKLATEALARLIEGSHHEGLSLQLKGQGKGWQPAFEASQALHRLIAVGAFVDAKIQEGCTIEEAVFDAAEAFDISEVTVRRDLQMYRVRDDSRA